MIELSKKWPFTIARGENGECMIDLPNMGPIAAEQIMALILKEIKTTVKARLGVD